MSSSNDDWIAQLDSSSWNVNDSWIESFTTVDEKIDALKHKYESPELKGFSSYKKKR